MTKPGARKARRASQLHLRCSCLASDSLARLSSVKLEKKKGATKPDEMYLFRAKGQLISRPECSYSDLGSRPSKSARNGVAPPVQQTCRTARLAPRETRRNWLHTLQTTIVSIGVPTQKEKRILACWNGFGHGELSQELHPLLGPAPTGLDAQNNQFATSCRV